MAVSLLYFEPDTCSRNSNQHPVQCFRNAEPYCGVFTLSARLFERIFFHCGMERCSLPSLVIGSQKPVGV
jgi:hypothetical protein